MQVALIKFKEAGKKYHFSYQNLNIEQDQKVVVETARGVEIGTVYMIKEVDQSDLVSELKPVLRVASEDDMRTDVYNQSLEEQVINETKKLVKRHELSMKVLGAEYTLDRKRLLIYFEAEDRVDFRNLVKDLNKIFHTRIELRQIGPRDAAKMIGGIGPCGLILCCTTFIGEFDTVSIKMAKNQNLALNPQKISGVCGKLLCCIRYEDETYTELKKILPDIHEIVDTEVGQGKVIDLNILSQRVKVRFQNDEPDTWFKVDKINRIKH
jgi:cell fate regulator YaaT (PSP1 superfamily)